MESIQISVALPIDNMAQLALSDTIADVHSSISCEQNEG